jgi:hypothetical protein
MILRLVRSTVLGCALLIASAPFKSTYAQAWVPSQGEGQITITYENLYVRDHFDYTGKRFDAGPIRTHTVIATFEYGVTNKLTLDADITHVTSKYEGFVGPVPHGPPDTGFYHPTFQDARIGIRYGVFRKRLLVTPFVAAVIPTHHYETRGHSAVGRDLRELQMGINVGRDLEDIIPRTYFQARYSYAFVQNVRQFGLNRSNVDWEFGYFLKPRLSLRFTGAWQFTHSGLRYPLDQDVPDFHELHDRAAKSEFMRFGGGLTVSLTKYFDLHADVGNTYRGRTTHGARGLSLGLSWRFSRGGFRVGKF